jgi:hypothetical protein
MKRAIDAGLNAIIPLYARVGAGEPDGYTTGDGRVTYALMAITAATTLGIFWGTLHLRRLV